MTNDKAREFFSAFHEGTLEPGLRASLERRFDADAGLRSEYAAFVETLESLDSLRQESIDIPSYLSSRIADRLDPVLDAKRAPFWHTLFAPRQTGPGYGWALGVAGLALAAAIGLRGFEVTGVAPADLSGLSAGASDSVHWTKGGEDVVVSFGGTSAREVSITPEGGSAQNFSLAPAQPFELTLSNPNGEARRFDIAVGNVPFATVAVPGKRNVRRTGNGTLGEMASALADTYKVAVVVKGLPLNRQAHWNFEGVDARAAAEANLGGHGNATMMDDRLLQIGG